MDQAKGRLEFGSRASTTQEYPEKTFQIENQSSSEMHLDFNFESSVFTITPGSITINAFQNFGVKVCFLCCNEGNFADVLTASIIYQQENQAITKLHQIIDVTGSVIDPHLTLQDGNDSVRLQYENNLYQ